MARLADAPPDNDQDNDLMEKINEDNALDKGENQKQNIKHDLDNEHEDQAAVLAWTAARLLALPVEVSVLQVERPFLGPPRGKAPSRP